MLRRDRRDSLQFLRDHSHIQVAVKLVAPVSGIKNVQEVLVQKELELAKVKRELQALRSVVKLLRDEDAWVREAAQPTLTVTGESLIEREAVRVKMQRSEANVEKTG